MKTIATILSISLSSFVVLACGRSEPADISSSETTSVAAPATAPAAEANKIDVTTIDPCVLVPRQDMQTMFGELKEGPTPGTGLRNERQCNYTNTAGEWIKLSVYGGTDRWQWEKGITNAQNPRDIGGLGDEAFAIKRGTDAVVYVRKGETILELSCSCPAERAEAISRVATTKL